MTMLKFEQVVSINVWKIAAGMANTTETDLGLQCFRMPNGHYRVSLFVSEAKI